MPQRIGVATRPRWDEKRWSSNESNGTCGRSLTVIVSWPVPDGCTEANSFEWMPKPSAIMKTLYWSPGFGSPK